MEDAHKTDAVPQYLYKILTKSAWEQSVAKGELVLSSIDDAFIHFSKKDQVDRVVGEFFRETPYVVLQVDTDQLVGELIFEANPGGKEKYYHLYNGSIPFESTSLISES